MKLQKHKKTNFPLFKFIIFSIALLLIISTGLVIGEGSYEVETGAYPIKITDDLGNTLTLNSKPQKIASGTLLTDEILLSLVEKERLIAVTKLSEDPEISNISGEVADIPNKITLNVEVIVSLSPDIIFLASWSDSAKVKQLRDAGLNVYQIKSPVTINEIESTIKKIAHVVGEEKNGTKIVSWMEDKLNSVERVVSAVPQTKKLTVMDYGTWGASFGSGSSWNSIVEHAGLKNAVASLKSDQWGNVPVSKEKLIELDPDILILPSWVWGDPTGADKFFKKIVTDPSLQSMKAIKNNRVYRIPEKYKSATSQYIVYAVEELAKLAYPDKFKKTN